MAEDPKGNRGGPSVRTDGPEATSGRDRPRADRGPRERGDAGPARGPDDAPRQRNRGGDGPRAEGPRAEGPRTEGAPRTEGDRGPRAEGDRGPRAEGDRGPRAEGDRGPRGEGDRGPRGPRPERRDDRRGPPRDDRRGPPRDDRRNDSASPLTASLFSAMQDKQVKCRIAGCENTWTWFAAQQIRGFGQPPPDRMCDEHLGQFNELTDREVPCRTPGCPNTWTWKRGAQLAELQRTGKLRRPSRLCGECFSAERETHDVELPCKVDGCKRSWTWTRDAQLRHRLWVLRQRAKADAAAARNSRPPREAQPRVEPEDGPALTLSEASPVDMLAITVERPLPFLGDLSSTTGPEEHVPEASSEATSTEAGEASEAAGEGEGEAHEPGGDRRKRRRKRRRGGKPVPNPEGPPERMCGLCAQKLSRVQPKEQPCKVHGCSRTWTWDRASQMRAWVLSGSDDVEFEPAAPKRMCDVCREFCRTHPDREVPCGRPGCANTWTFKTGAQLQAFLAGRTADPLKLCGECAKGEFAASFRPGAEGGAVPEGAETMPCVVPGCEGTWLYIPGMRLRDTAYGELSPDRMCDRHREERGFAAASPPEPQEVEVTAADLAADEEHEEHEQHDEPDEHEHGHDEPTDEPGDDLRDADDLPEVPDAADDEPTDAGTAAEPEPIA